MITKALEELLALEDAYHRKLLNHNKDIRAARASGEKIDSMILSRKILDRRLSRIKTIRRHASENNRFSVGFLTAFIQEQKHYYMNY